MERHELNELHYITPIANVSSILLHGILSHARAARTAHASVAMAEIQDRRSRVVVPGGRRLHEYANLYICVRNPMLFKRRPQFGEICVLSVSPAVLDLPGVVITDANASSDYCRFAPAPEGLRIVDRALTFADNWTDPNQIQYFQKKSAKCAEVLVPNRIDPRYLMVAYVADDRTKARFDALETRLTTEVNLHLFFAGEGTP